MDASVNTGDQNDDQSPDNSSIQGKDIFGIVKTTSSMYIATLEERFRSVSHEISEKLAKKAGDKKVTDNLRRILAELETKRNRQLEEYEFERKKAEDRLAAVENQILNMQIFNSNLNEHNDLIKLFVQIWKNKLAEIEKK